MIKNISRLEHKIGDRVYQVLCDTESPLAELKEALCQFLKFVGQVEDHVKAQQAQAEADKLKAEDAKEEIVVPEHKGE